MNEFLKRAMELKDETVANRRKVHQFGGLGFDIKETSDLVFDALVSYGLKPERMCGTGVVCTIGDHGKTILLRADMDALPMVEESGLPFAATNGTAHTCGHDMHTAMLLTAAKILSENQDKIEGRVKLMFQPAEETLNGCAKMVEAGVLENPHVDVAMAMHTTVGHEDIPTGYLRYTRNITMGACNMVNIKVVGKGCHGAYPTRGIDPINIACRIVTGVQELMAMELPATESAVVSFGSFHAGASVNTIPEYAELGGTIRTLSKDARALLLKRVKEIAEKTAETFRGEAIVEYPLSCGLCLVDNDLLDEMITAWSEVVDDRFVIGEPVNGSEDFGFIMERIPSVHVFLGAGAPSEGHVGTAHLPNATFDESVLPIGAAVYVTSAIRWLKNHQ